MSQPDILPLAECPQNLKYPTAKRRIFKIAATSTVERWSQKENYEYLKLEDHKPSGFEPDDQRSGYVFEGLTAYRELRDDRVSFFLTFLARGQHSINYRLRAETPGKMSALPATIEGMYSTELVGNSDEFKLRVVDRE